jgi:hypothetical protein
MNALAAPRPHLLRRITARTWALVLAGWGILTGALPHVLHHIGPLAGAAVLVGAGGRLLFAGVALVVSIPFLLRIHKRFRKKIAPAAALAAMAAAYTLSTFVIAPLLTGGEGSSPQRPGVQQPAGHMGHHHN